ncbi:MAG: hypothetical protein ACR2PZ_09940, partial [Pseudomonadales bacterium]
MFQLAGVKPADIVAEHRQPLPSRRREQGLLMCMVRENRLARFDVPVRAWAAQEERVADAVKHVDGIRIGTVS